MPQFPSNKLPAGIQTPMAISHEVSSEIAAAILERRDRSPNEMLKLKEMLLQVHSTLEDLQASAKVDTELNPSEPAPRTKAASTQT